MSQQQPPVPSSSPTPGVERIVSFFVRGGEFRIRRPSRGDNAEILRRYTAKLMRACPTLGDFAAAEVAKEALQSLDGGSLLTEARLEVLLLPRVGTTSDEHPPTHWLHEIKDPDQRVIARSVVFDQVDPDEFDEVALWVDQFLSPGKKNDSAKGTSTDSAPGTTSG